MHDLASCIHPHFCGPNLLTLANTTIAQNGVLHCLFVMSNPLTLTVPPNSHGKDFEDEGSSDVIMLSSTAKKKTN